MSFLTTNMKELQKSWMKVYLNFMMLKTHHQKANAILQSFKNEAALFNEKAMQFFDAMQEKI